MIERVGTETFDDVRLRRGGTVVVGFLADWCPFCTSFLPELEALAGAGTNVLLADVSDEESPLWDRFRIAIVPTLLVFHEGAETYRRDGVGGVGLGRRDTEAVRAEVERLRHEGGSPRA